MTLQTILRRVARRPAALPGRFVVLAGLLPGLVPLATAVPDAPMSNSATAPPAAQASTPVSGHRRPVVEQKLRLMEALLRSDAAKAAAETAEGRARNARLDEMVGQARQALVDQQIDRAGQLLDDAIRLASAGSHRQALGEGTHQAHFQELVEQVNSYRNSIRELEQDPQLQATARALRERIDALVAEAGVHNAAGRVGEAHKALRGAYQLAIAELGRLRSGKTVVVALKFATPAEEYGYEQRRHTDHQMLLRMALTERQVPAEQRAAIDGFVAESQRLSVEADSKARGGSYPEAVRTMEKATAVLVQALRSVGVPLF